MRRKSRHPARKASDAIVIKLTDEQKKNLKESLGQQDLTQFQVEEIEIKVVPIVRLKNHIFTP
jgi:hypothetical protein